MTNALAQNIDTNNYELEMLATATNVASNNKQTQDNSEFSNMLNSLEARSNKAQRDFDKNTKVTNTSSINQKALIRNDSKNEVKEVVKNTTTKEPAKESTAEETSKNQTKNEISKETTNTTNNETKIKDTENKKVEIKAEKNETQTEQSTSKEDLSDINNSSPVESSPVFSSNEVNLDEASKEEIKNALDEVEVALDELIQTIPVADETSTIEIQDLKTKIDELLNNLENSNEAIKTVDEISSMLDDSNFNQDFKNEITKTLDDLKETLNSLKDITKNTSFEDLIAQLKQKATSLLDGVMLEINEKTNTKEVFALNLDETIVNQEDIEAIFEQSKIIDSSKVDEKMLDETTKEVGTLIKDIKDALESNDAQKLSESLEKLPEILEKINTLSKENEDLKIEFDKKLVDSLKNLEQTIEDVFNKNNFETLENLNLDDFKNIETTDKKSLNKLVQTLENLNNDSYFQTDDEIKTQIEDLIKKINDGKITTQQLNQAIDSITDEIKPQVKIESNAKSEIEIEMPDVENISNFEQDNDFLNKDFNQNDSFEFENEVKLKANVSKEIDIKNVEQNLQKTIATQEMLDEMMVEVDIKTIPVQSGALSVVDEVTKLAMGETNTLNSINSSNTVTYDSTGVNAVIKNIAQLTKSAQVQTPSETPSMEDLMNQVTNKITQLKDSSAQKLTLVLRPNDLGRLQIELTSNQNGLTTQIMAQNEQVRAYIEKNIDSLRLQLSENGVNVNSIQIRSAGSDSATTYDGNQNLARQQDENLNQQNNKQNQQHEQKNDNKDAKEMLASMSNYDMSFVKDFSNVLNKSLNYSLN